MLSDQPRGMDGKEGAPVDDALHILLLVVHLQLQPGGLCHALLPRNGGGVGEGVGRISGLPAFALLQTEL